MKLVTALVQSQRETAFRYYGGDYMCVVTDLRAETGSYCVQWMKGAMPPFRTTMYDSLEEFEASNPETASLDDWEPDPTEE